MAFVIEQKKTPVVRKVDVVVVGGGPGGFGAAVAAAQNGAETLLIERYGFLGGMLTGGLVLWLPIDKLTPLRDFGETEALQGGIIKDLVDRLVSLGGATEPSVSYHTAVGFDAYFPTDPEITKVVLQDMIEESGADLLLHSLAVDVVKEGNLVQGVIIESKSGREAILADILIDASGDADMAAAAGAEYEKIGRPLMMTLTAAMANVDVEKAIKYSRREGRAEFDKLVDEAVKKGEMDISEKKVLPGAPPVRVSPGIVLDPSRLPANYYRRGEACGWRAHFSGDCTNVNDLTRAEITTRKSILPIVNFFRKYVPGYERAYIAYTGTQIGVRESRRVLGGYYLTFDKDMRGGLRHSDVIVKCRNGGSVDLATYAPEVAPIFDIPYRCIVPNVIDGLLTAGRCISIDHDAATLLSPRDESTCMCLGEAAGTAAALSIKNKVKPRDLDIKILQDTLEKQGANLR